MGLPAPSSDALASSFSEVLLAGVAHVSVAGLETSFFDDEEELVGGGK